MPKGNNEFIIDGQSFRKRNDVTRNVRKLALSKYILVKEFRKA